VLGLLQRLAASGAAYQASSLLAGLLAIFTLPLYTRHLTRAELGYAETLLTAIILTSILLRLGIGEALVRFWFDDSDQARRRRLARTVTGIVLGVSTVAALVALALAEPISQALLNTSDATLVACGVLGLWAFTNLEVAYALLRVEERRRTYLAASVSNVLLTVALTVTLVVVLDGGARGYVLGNYVASTVVLLALWAGPLRGLVGVPVPETVRTAATGALLRFGAPTVPADATVFALNVVDRAYLLRAQSAAAAGVYSVSVKLATVVIVAVRGFQAAWPPLAYSVTDEAQAKRLYATVTTYYVLLTGLIVAALVLLGRWIVDLLTAPAFADAYQALPWVGLGWALYGLFLVFVTIAGRARVTTRTFPAAAAGLVVNVLALVVLVDPLGIAGAGLALCASYVVMLAVAHLLTRRLFTVPFERGRLALLVTVIGGVAAAGELLLPTSGAAGFAARLAALAAIPLVLLAAGFLRPEERRALRRLAYSRRPPVL
jgi:O-antigen/teichoic acid export membrane protein